MNAKNLRFLTAVLTAVWMLVSSLAMAAPPHMVPHDVALQNGGVLHGQVVDSQGSAQQKALVVLLSGKKEVARTETDRRGRFSVAGLQGGVYEVAAARNRGVYRLWAPHTAPPAAQQGLMIVAANDFVLGQDCGSGVGDCSGACGVGHQQGPLRSAATWMAKHPVITAGAIAAAIAIPLAVDDDDAPATN